MLRVNEFLLRKSTFWADTLAFCGPLAVVPGSQDLLGQWLCEESQALIQGSSRERREFSRFRSLL